VHHIIVRGIERRRIFRDDLDRERFIEKFGSISVEGTTLQSFRLTPVMLEPMSAVADELVNG
jgi:hypothetical protein